MLEEEKSWPTEEREEERKSLHRSYLATFYFTFQGRFIMLSKENRISRSAQYSSIYKYGKKTPGRYMIAFVIPNQLENNRFGIVTSKKLGKAVARNKVKRQLRAIVHKGWDKLKPGYDVVIVARKNLPGTSFVLVERDFFIVMRKAGLC